MTVLLGRASFALVGIATALVILTGTVVPFLTPQWVAFEQGRADATAWTGYTTEELRTATDSILADLVFGPADFDLEVRGQPVLDEREQGHMRDVRAVFVGLWVVAAASVAVLVLASRRRDRRATWRAVRGGAIGLTGVVVVLGAVALVAFDALFEFFHQVFFPAGSYTFDPATERLVQLFPFQFWDDTALVLGVVMVVVALAVAVLAGRRAAAFSTKLPATELTPARATQ